MDFGSSNNLAQLAGCHFLLQKSHLPTLQAAVRLPAAGAYQRCALQALEWPPNHRCALQATEWPPNQRCALQAREWPPNQRCALQAREWPPNQRWWNIRKSKIVLHCAESTNKIYRRSKSVSHCTESDSAQCDTAQSPTQHSITEFCREHFGLCKPLLALMRILIFC